MGVLFLLGASFPAMGGDVVLRFVSGEYTLKDGSMLVFSSDIKRGILNLHTGERFVLTHEDQPLRGIALVNGESERIRVSEPGMYTIWLRDLVVIRTRSGMQVRVPQLTLGTCEVTEAALKTGVVEIKLPPVSLIRVRAVDQAGRAKRNQPIDFSDAHARLSFQAPTDSQGEVYLLGKLEDYTIRLRSPDDKSIKLQISIE